MIAGREVDRGEMILVSGLFKAKISLRRVVAGSILLMFFGEES